jgi:CRISPR/Cas system Type II protein with McrA/HNH and RuvC-like nuclease domain
MHNKVLTKKRNNENKGNLTVAQFIPHLIIKEEYKIFCKRCYLNANIAYIDPIKYGYLVDTETEYQEIVRKNGFVGRNLSDTSYISSLVLKTLKAYKSHFFDSVNINTTNGFFTRYIRKLFKC